MSERLGPPVAWLDDATGSVVLPDGRSVTFLDGGDRDGYPVIGSTARLAPLESNDRRLGVRGGGCSLPDDGPSRVWTIDAASGPHGG